MRVESANRVRELRVGLLLTQAQLARKARCALRTVWNVERGLRCLPSTRRRLLKALGVPFERRTEVFPDAR